MDKTELAREIGRQLGLPRAAASRALDAALKGIEAGLRRDGEVAIRGFGTFRRDTTAMRVLPHPKTGKKRWTKPRQTVRFVPGQPLDEAIQGPANV